MLKRFQDLSAAVALTGTEIVPITQSGGDVQTTTQDIANLAVAGSGDVTGPASAVDDRIVTFDGATGKLIQDSGVGIAALTGAIADLVAAGIGEAAGVVLTDLNVALTTEPMFFSFAGSTTNAPHTNTGCGVHIPVDATRAFQLATSASTSATTRLFMRTAVSSVYGSWIELARRSPSVSTTTSGAITPNWRNFDIYARTSQSAGLTVNAPGAGDEGADGQLVGIAVKDDGTVRAITWNAVYTGSALPATTIVGETLWVWFMRNATLSTYEYQFCSRPVPNVQAVTSASTVTPTFAQDAVKITALAAACQLLNPTGTAIPMHGWAIRIKDNGTARALTYDTQYRAIGVTLPTTTVLSKTLYLGCIWNAEDSKVDVVAVAQEV
jgi:hypothetical protein